MIMESLKKNLVYSLLIILCSCLFGCEARHPKMVAVDNFNSAFVKHGEKKYHLAPFGTGGGWPFDHINFLSVSFASNDLVDIDGARKILLPLVEDMLVMMEKDEKLQPWMKEQPQTYNSVDTGINFQRCFRSSPEVADNYIYMALAINGRLSYYKYDISINNCTKIYSETIEEAKQKVKDN